jgi:hypothetical protein
MGELRLTGLKSGLPIGFMAALGTFRHAVAMPELGEVKLKWTPYAGQWCATLVTGAEIEADELARLFVERVKGMKERPEFEWAEQIKKNSVSTFRSEAAKTASLEEWFTAFGSELALAKDGTVRSTLFDMTGGQQRFLLKLRQASGFLAVNANAAIDLFKEAIFGPWQYKASRTGVEIESSHSLGLDPMTLLEGAFTGSEPAEIKDKRGIRGAIWLAFEALPLFPSVYDRTLATVGFSRSGKKTYFEWAVWESPLSLRAVKTVLMHPTESADRIRGAVAKYRSERVNLNKDYCCFSPAELTG